MADSTRSKSNLDCLEDAIAKLTASQFNLSMRLDDICQKVATLETRPLSLSSSSANLSTAPSFIISDRMKLEVPRIDGSNPFWVALQDNPIFRVS